MEWSSWEHAAKMNSTEIVDVSQAMEVLHNGGPEAMSVYVVLSSLKDKRNVTVAELAAYTNLSVPTVERACYKLGLEMLGVVTS